MTTGINMGDKGKMETPGGQCESVGIDPQIQTFADTVLADYENFAAGPNPSVQQARVTAEAVRRRWVEGGPEMARISDHRVPLGGSEVGFRLFEAEAGGESPALVYLHGGGWTIFSLDTHDRLMREYAARAGVKVIGVDFSLAPEARFPRQIDEIVAVIEWLQANGAGIGVDPGSLAIGGDSAGANLAVAVGLKLRDGGGTAPLKALLLNYGVFSAELAYAEQLPETPEHFILTFEEMSGFWQNYLRGPSDQSNPLASPILAELGGLPPTFMAIADQDILLAENLELAGRLRQGGVDVTPVVYPGTTHSFLEAVSIAQVSDRGLAEASAWLSGVLHPAK